jgi:hypothetical protein
VDWAGFTLGKRTKGSVECSGGTLYDPDTPHPRYVTLAYGETWRHGVFTCTSRTTGVTCRNPAGANAESTGVTTRYFNSTAPTASASKCKDSAGVNFTGGNPYKQIGEWTMTLP